MGRVKEVKAYRVFLSASVVVFATTVEEARERGSKTRVVPIDGNGSPYRLPSGSDYAVLQSGPHFGRPIRFYGDIKIPRFNTSHEATIAEIVAVEKGEEFDPWQTQ